MIPQDAVTSTTERTEKFYQPGVGEEKREYI